MSDSHIGKLIASVGCECEHAPDTLEEHTCLAGRAEQELVRLRKVVRGIATANQREWVEELRDAQAFKEWAQSICRHALAALEVEPKRCTCAERLREAALDGMHNPEGAAERLEAGYHFEGCPALEVTP
jgi:hypothetical protein